jgi:DnaK suppressor protein
LFWISGRKRVAAMDTSIKAKLLALRAELISLNDLGSEAADVVELDQSKVGRLSRMDAMQAQAMAKDALRRRQAQLRNISIALERLDAGAYGRCEICDEDIGTGRLEIDPAILTCIHCADKPENDNR